jgi:hypothetical protein
MTTVIPTLINTQMSAALTFMTSTMMIGTTNTTEGYWPSYNHEAGMQGSPLQESSQYEEHETANADLLIEEDDDSVIYDDGLSQ